MRIPLLNRVAAGMHQMGFAKSHPSVKVKGVVSLSGRFRYRQRSCMSKLIARPNHKVVEGVF